MKGQTTVGIPDLRPTAKVPAPPLVSDNHMMMMMMMIKYDMQVDMIN
jgi:hypothetical protein